MSNLSEPFFSSRWSVYDKVMRGGYLDHQEFYATLQSCRRGSSMLELGCGDGRWTGQLLEGVTRYIGVDQSAPAVESARGNLQGADFRFHAMDALEFLESTPVEPVDCILSSYCLHHLAREEKAALLSRLAEWLLPGGQFLLLDVFLAPGETREEYFSHRHQWVRQDWTELSPEERAQVVHHEEEADFPESVAWYQEQAALCGLGGGQELREGSRGMSHLLVFTRGDGVQAGPPVGRPWRSA